MGVFVLVFGGELLDELLERCELSLIDEVELLDKEDEVLEAGVEVGLLAQLHDLGEVLVVDVGVHAEQALQDGLGDGQEVLREGHAWKGRKQMHLLTIEILKKKKLVFSFIAY